MMKKLFVPVKTGIPAIDTQHEHYFKLINDFVFLSKNRHIEKSEAIKFFSEVVEYTVLHFDTEEFFMRSIDYPGYDNHVKIHDRFRASIEKQSEELEQVTNICKFSEAFAEWVSSWFAGHEATADLKLAEYCKEHNIHG
ncbi:MAG: hemerythrin family protein [Victivallaceae bacterium]